MKQDYITNLEEQKHFNFPEEVGLLSPNNRLKIKSSKDDFEFGLLKDIMPNNKTKVLYNTITDLFGKIENVISKIEEKIKKIVSNQEEDYITAYKGEMIEIQEILSSYKKKINEQEAKYNMDSKISVYEKSSNWFRIEAIRYSQLYQKVLEENRKNN